MKSLGIALAALLASPAGAQSVSFAYGTEDLTFVTGARTASTTSNTGPPAGAYTSYASKVTLTAANSTASPSTAANPAANLTQTAPPEPPPRTQACNNHVEFCTQRYSNITHVATHNSPFVRPGNSASNQELPVAARDRLYLMNHNLNVQFDVFGAQLLVPAVALLNDTNAAAGDGSLGLAANNCRAAWGRAPNFLNVDYNYGSPPGSVFEAAARVNNVGYDRPCCGHVSAARARGRGAWAALALAVLAVVV